MKDENAGYRFKKFYPDKWYESPYVIPFEDYYQNGYRGVLFDIDNTLVMDKAPADSQAAELFKQLQKTGFRTCIVSNATKERVELFAKSLGAPAVSLAKKPVSGAYKRGIDKIGCSESNTLFVGDQLLTDILGAKKMGVYALLVKPIHPKEGRVIKMKRQFEKLVLNEYCSYLENEGK